MRSVVGHQFRAVYLVSWFGFLYVAIEKVAADRICNVKAQHFETHIVSKFLKVAKLFKKRQLECF